MSLSEADDPIELIRHSGADPQVLGRIWGHYRERLRRVVRLRLDRRLQGRADPSDVLQEAFLDFQNRAAEYAKQPDMPFFLWLRFLTGQRLQLVHRHHLGTQMRDAGREVSLHRGAMPQATSVSLAAQLLGDEFLARCKRGEKPTIKEYCDRHPDLAGEIRDVFEAVLMVEDLRPVSNETSDSSVASVRVEGKRLKQVGDYRILGEIGRGG